VHRPDHGVHEGVGLEVALSFPPGGDGTFGPVDVNWGSKSPKGVGLSLDAGVVVGGISLCRPDRGEYCGVLGVRTRRP